LDGDAESLEGRSVLLIGGYGVGNVGDEAILAGLVQLHDLWDATVVSYDPAATSRLHGVRAVSPFRPGFPAALARCRLVVIGGGGMFSAYMGRFARAIPLAALLAGAAGKRVEFRAIGAYPGTPPATARLLASAVGRAGYASVRDASSLAYLRALGVRRRVELVPDPAFALEPASPDRAAAVLARAAPGLRGPFVALGVRRVKDPAEQGRLEAALVGLATVLLRAGVEPLFVPFSRHPYEPLEDDAVFARALVEAVGGGTVLEGEHHPRDVLGVVAQAECVVAVRFHALVFALRAGVPVVALPYDAKCDDLLAQMGRPGLQLADVNACSLAARVQRAIARAAPVGVLPPADDGAAPRPPGRPVAAVLREARP
jgi:polysaccharide pyruvyl transferase CsaB